MSNIAGEINAEMLKNNKVITDRGLMLNVCPFCEAKLGLMNQRSAA